jgi:hypothetical protein
LKWILPLKKCTPYSLLELILFPDQHKRTRSRLSSGKNLHKPEPEESDNEMQDDGVSENVELHVTFLQKKLTKE